MKLTQKTILLMVVVLAFVGTSLVMVYNRLGGDKEVEVLTGEDQTRLVLGREFVGKQTSQEIQVFFEESRAMIREGKYAGELAIVNYKVDTLASNQLAFFIGIHMEDRPAAIPDGFEVREFTGSRYYAAQLDMHPLVRPAPGDVEQQLVDAALADGITLQNYFLELHFPDNTLRVEAYGE